MKSIKRATTKLRAIVSGYGPNFNPDKKELIDFTGRMCVPPPKTFADLGGVWNVDGAYGFYALHEFDATHGCIVDTDFSEKSMKLSKSEPKMELIRGNFGEESVAARIGTVDAVFLFDVLLHQVKPDWNDVLATYASRTTYFVIFNQQWIRGKETIRLLDLGREAYFENVPIGPGNPTYAALFDKMDEIHPEYDRPWRDIHKVWQWGITDLDLARTMDKLGFEQRFYYNYGRFRSLPNFENHGFVFQRRLPGALASSARATA